MAFQTFNPKRKAISLDELGEVIATRRKAVGEVEVVRNSGKRRTASKCALLQEIAKAGGDW